MGHVVPGTLPVSGHRLRAPINPEPFFPFPASRPLLFLLFLSSLFLCPPHSRLLSQSSNVCRWHKRPFSGLSLIILLWSPIGSPCVSKRASGTWLVGAYSQSQSHVATDGQSVSQSWCRAPPGAHDQKLSFSPRLYKVLFFNFFFTNAVCSACCLLYAGFLLGLLFDPEDRGDMFIRNVGWLQPDYTVLYGRR
jgi:hypothetical protein